MKFFINLVIRLTSYPLGWIAITIDTFKGRPNKWKL